MRKSPTSALVVVGLLFAALATARLTAALYYRWQPGGYLSFSPGSNAARLSYGAGLNVFTGRTTLTDVVLRAAIPSGELTLTSSSISLAPRLLPFLAQQALIYEEIAIRQPSLRLDLGLNSPLTKSPPTGPAPTGSRTVIAPERLSLTELDLAIHQHGHSGPTLEVRHLTADLRRIAFAPSAPSALHGLYGTGPFSAALVKSASFKARAVTGQLELADAHILLSELACGSQPLPLRIDIDLAFRPGTVALEPDHRPVGNSPGPIDVESALVRCQ